MFTSAAFFGKGSIALLLLEGCGLHRSVWDRECFVDLDFKLGCKNGS